MHYFWFYDQLSKRFNISNKINEINILNGNGIKLQKKNNFANIKFHSFRNGNCFFQ